MLVHGLETDARLVRSARQALAARGLYGRVSVEQLAPDTLALPYAENLVNLVVAENPGRISDEEMLRVLAPGGTAWIRRNDKWTSIRKPWPKALDEWTHWRHAADGNMVSRDTAVEVPTGLRWIAGPAQDAGGRKWYYDHVLVSSRGRNFYVYENEIVARDAFNGRLLWTKESKAATFKEKAAGGGTRTSKVRPVAAGERLYAIVSDKLVALDAATGNIASSFDDVEEPREVLLEKEMLVVSDRNSIRAFDSKGERQWIKLGNARRIVAADNKVFYISGDQAASLDLQSGSEVWTSSEPGIAQATTLSFGCGVLALERASWNDLAPGNGITVLSGETGALLWKKDHKPGMSHYQETRAFFANGLLWMEMDKSKCGGFDPKTGAEMKLWSSRGQHCAVPVATERFFIAPELEFTNLETGQQSRARMVKSACRISFVPANGLLYTFPVQCECFPMLRGYMGLSSAPPPANPEGKRLEKAVGPASVPVGVQLTPAGTPVPPIKLIHDEWPAYRHDAWRSGGTSRGVHGREIKQLWEAKLAAEPPGLLAADWKDNPSVKGLVTAPVVAGGRVFAAACDTHTLFALDARNGKTLWTFSAGGRIDSPPTIHEDLCLFGAHDGWVYCVNTKDGELAWRFRAAPRETRILSYGQLESPWPVPGSVLVDNGRAFVAAGRHPAADGGVRVCALNARTGFLVWEKVVTDSGIKAWYGGTLPNRAQKIGVDYEPVDMLVKDGPFVSMSRWRFNPGNGDFKLAVDSLEYTAFESQFVARGVWGYGIRQTKMVYPKPPVAFDASHVYTGEKSDAALLLAGDALISATANGELKFGEQKIVLESPAVHDGLAAAYGLLFVSTQDGKVRCFGSGGVTPPAP
jgi:outer membrane protein assembly factor BamB